MKAVLSTLYNKLIRPRLSYKIGVYNGVQVLGTVRELDLTDEFPNYKNSNISALKRYVSFGDDIVVIGGGIGVTTVVSAFQTGKSGSVMTYEASLDEIQTIRRTLEINKVDNVCTVHHAVVGPAIEIEGNIGNPTSVDPSNLPECDVLEIDAEGAERDILPSISTLPGTIIVETHPKFGSTTREIKQALTAMEYKIENEVADPDDGDILTAKLMK
jgi:hypothetical protein